MRSRRRLSAWSGAVVGIAAAAALTWLVGKGVLGFMSAAGVLDQGRLTGSVWLLFGVGVGLAATAFGARFHPLIAAVPAGWFLVLFGPALLGMAGPASWYPQWMRSYFLGAASPAAFIVTGILVAEAIAAYVWRRPPSPIPAAVDAEEIRS